MHTIALECPNCGAAGSAPKDKIHSRLVCKKCHSIFHITSAGRVVLGEPVTDEPRKEDHHSPAHKGTDEVEPLISRGFSRVPLLAVLAIGLLALGGYGLSSVRLWAARPGNNVMPQAEAVAQALAGENRDAFTATVLPGTETAAADFYDKALLLIAPTRSKSPVNQVESKVLVLDVDANQSLAQVVSYFTPKKGNSRAQQISEVATDGAARSIANLTLWFSKDRQGAWRLDGNRCVADKSS